jgi:signal transduction histidine kinase/ligand-binding sensor domain-containing protein
MRMNMIGQSTSSINFCVGLFVMLCFPLQIFSADRSIAQFVHTAWGDKEGAPSGVNVLAQTTDGYLWIGAVDGLFRFDGVSFERYQPGVTYALFSRPNGDLWIGRNAAIILLKNGKEITYTVRDGVPNGRTAGFALDGEGTLWVATSVGPARFEGNRWEQVGSDWGFPGKLATGMCLDQDGTLWIATESTIVFLPRGARKFQPTGISSGQVWKIAKAPNGRLWLAETSRSVRPMPLHRNLPPSDKTEIMVDGCVGILFDREGALWMTTVAFGLRRVAHPEKLEDRQYADGREPVGAFTSKDGLTHDYATSILEDREGNIWVGTNDGLDCFHTGKLTPIVSPFPLVQSLLQVGDAGHVWISSQQTMFETQGWENSTVTTTPDLFQSAYRNANGVEWWSGNGFVSRLKGRRFERLPPRTTKPPFARCPTLTEDHNGVLWGAVEYEGIFYLQNDIWRQFETPPEIARLRAQSGFTDWMGRIWFGFDGGGALVTIDGGKLRVLAASHESPVGRVAYSIRGRGKHIWIGGERLVYFDGGNFREVVPSDTDAFKVFGIEETSDGSLWLSEDRGVVHIPSTEVRRFLENFSYRVQYDLFDSADGLPGSFHDAAARSRVEEGTDGRLWFATTRGVAWLDPAAISRNTLLPPVSIRSVNANGRQYMPEAHLALPPRLANLKIAYTALSLSIPARVRFRYKLEGVDGDWQSPGTRREAFYTGLAPGNYRFRVIACNNDGVWNEEGATLDFSVAPAWYQTIWFRVSCMGVSVLLLWTLYQLRLQHLQRQFNMTLEARVGERTRIARDLHDTLLQSFNALLLRFQAASDLFSAHSDEAKGVLDSAIDQAGEALIEGRDAVQQLRSTSLGSNDLVSALGSLGKALAADGSSCDNPAFHIEVEGTPQDLLPITRDEIYRIAGEALRNAFRHARARNLEVAIHYDPRQLRLRIRDDGQGIDPQLLRTDGLSGHYGLSGMRERAQSLGGELTIWSEVNSGTEIDLTVPSSIAYTKPGLSRLRILTKRSQTRS